MYALNSLDSYDWDSAVSDPRLISSAHSGQQLLLDAPVRNGNVEMTNVYNHRPGYSTNYGSYADIGGGDVSYYYDASIGAPFIQPLYESSPVVKIDYVDPMGSYKPHFFRDPTKIRGPGLTWLRDSQYQRADIMSRQAWKRNQTERLMLYGVY